MATDDNETHSAVAAYSEKIERNLAVDRAATVVLLAVQAFLVDLFRANTASQLTGLAREGSNLSAFR